MLQNSPLFQLYLVRLRDFYRQPARIFWVYGFPTVLAVVLGLAFQNRLPAPIQIDLTAGPRLVVDQGGAGIAQRRAGAGAGGRPDAAGRPGGDGPRGARGPGAAEEGEVAPGHRAGRARSRGSITTIRPGPRPPPPGRWLTTSSSGPRVARTRRQPSDVYVTEPGSRYVDFLIPGLIAVNTMGGGLWGIGFLLVNFRIGKLLKRFVATPMPRRDFLLALLGARLTFLIPDLTVLLLLGTLAFHMPIRGNLGLVVLVDVVGALAFAGHRPAGRLPGDHHRGRQRADEPGHAAACGSSRASSSRPTGSPTPPSRSSRPCR